MRIHLVHDEGWVQQVIRVEITIIISQEDQYTLMLAGYTLKRLVYTFLYRLTLIYIL